MGTNRRGSVQLSPTREDRAAEEDSLAVTARTHFSSSIEKCMSRCEERKKTNHTLFPSRISYVYSYTNIAGKGNVEKHARRTFFRVCACDMLQVRPLIPAWGTILGRIMRSLLAFVCLGFFPRWKGVYTVGYVRAWESNTARTKGAFESHCSTIWWLISARLMSKLSEMIFS